MWGIYLTPGEVQTYIANSGSARPQESERLTFAQLKESLVFKGSLQGGLRAQLLKHHAEAHPQAQVADEIKTVRQHADMHATWMVAWTLLQHAALRPTCICPQKRIISLPCPKPLEPANRKSYQHYKTSLRNEQYTAKLYKSFSLVRYQLTADVDPPLVDILIHFVAQLVLHCQDTAGLRGLLPTEATGNWWMDSFHHDIDPMHTSPFDAGGRLGGIMIPPGRPGVAVVSFFAHRQTGVIFRGEGRQVSSAGFMFAANSVPCAHGF